jgi:dTDP-4-amino-4,6-dideoxygalactose transaminase
MVPFNKPYTTGNEIGLIENVIKEGKLCGNGKYTKLCQAFFEEQYKINKCLLTSSCTDALEMCGILLDLQAGDEVIMPSYTFVSTANAFMLRNASIIFCDSEKDNPNIDADKIEALITPRTKCIVVVHYAGFACDMDKIMAIANKHNIFVVEDAAQAIDSFYINGKGEQQALGSIGHLGAFSFHETKNISCGEGGMLTVNDDRFVARAEIIWEKGTNRSAFYRGEVDKYGWVDIGSSFLMSEISAAFLYAQLQAMKSIQEHRNSIWNIYHKHLSFLNNEKVYVQHQPTSSTNNAHLFYMVCSSIDERSRLIAYMKENGAQLVFHYSSLHKSSYFSDRYKGHELPNSDRFSDCLVRLPLYNALTLEQAGFVADKIKAFYQ